MSSKNQRVDQLDDYGEHMDESDSGEAGTCDLIVLGLPWKATENDIRDYFESYGPMAMVQLKTKEGIFLLWVAPRTRNSRFSATNGGRETRN